MSRFFENKTYRQLLFGATLVAVVAYAWMGSKVMAPRVSLPSSIGSVVVHEKGEGKSLEDGFKDHAFLLIRGTKEMDRFESAIRLIGGLATPVDLLVNFDEPHRYLVTENRVEIGFKLLEADGQLAKALTKAWLFQKARADLTGSLLRLEVVSDLLWAMLNGSLGLELPGRAETIKFPKAAPWLLFATPLKAHCESVWRSMELQSLCAFGEAGEGGPSDSIHATSFRPLLGGMVWGVYRELPLMARLDFLKAWVSWVIAGTAPDESQRPEAIGQWRSWLRMEFERLLPAHLMEKAGLAEPEGYAAIVDSVLDSAGLADRSGFDVDFLFRAPTAGSDEMRLLANVIAIGNEKIWKSKSVALVETSQGTFTLPGLARLAENDTEGLRTRQLVWESCAAPSIQEIIGDQVKSQRILYVKNCKDPLKATYSPLVSMGIQGFAAANPGLTFALMRRPSVELAASKKLLGNASVLNDLLNRTIRLGDMPSQLGFREAKWNPDIKAYKVLGAVEAIEWFRAEGESAEQSN